MIPTPTPTPTAINKGRFRLQTRLISRQTLPQDADGGKTWWPLAVTFAFD